MHFPSLLTSLLAAAPLAAAAPAQASELTARQGGSQVDWKQACEGARPAADELGVMVTTDHTVVWDGSNLGSTTQGRKAILFNQACEAIAHGDWQPNSPGFLWEPALIRTRVGGIGAPPIIETVQFKFSVAWIGPSDISTISTSVNGNVKNERWDSGEHSTLNGINAGYWRIVNFKPGSDWF